jgi:short-subunit dehydrogenase
MSAMVVGATTGVGRALCESLGARGEAVLMVASDARDLSSLASHIRLIYGARVEIVEADAENISEFIGKVSAALSCFGVVDNLFFPIGASRRNDFGLIDLHQTEAILNINLIAVISLITRLLPELMKQSNVNIVGFGSIAAIRGRSTNIIYSAAKRGLESYFESLRHLTYGTNIRVQFYRLGYVKTQQSFGQKLMFPVISPKQVSKMAIDNLNKDFGIKFYPKYWFFIALILTKIPWLLYKRLKF